MADICDNMCGARLSADQELLCCLIDRCTMFQKDCFRGMLVRRCGRSIAALRHIKHLISCAMSILLITVRVDCSCRPSLRCAFVDAAPSVICHQLRECRCFDWLPIRTQQPCFGFRLDRGILRAVELLIQPMRLCARNEALLDSRTGHR